MKTSNESGSKISKKEIQKQIRGILMKAVGLFGIRVPSKKLKKEIKGASKIVGVLVLDNLEKLSQKSKSKSKRLTEKDKRE